MKRSDRNIQLNSDEVQQYLIAARMHQKVLANFWISFGVVGLVVFTSVVIVFILMANGSFGWFANNQNVRGSSLAVSANGRFDFSLATVGRKEQGVYDGLVGLTKANAEEIGGVTYYIASANSSFHVNSDKNLNNYFGGADLRPGNRGSFDLYIICHSDERELSLLPILSAWYESESGLEDAFAAEAPKERQRAAEFLKGHILLFANMDEKGMYSGNIDPTKTVTVHLAEGDAYQTPERYFLWGEKVYEGEMEAVYRLPVYWVWPEQFGNFIYTGNSYNKNLFEEKDSDDYKAFFEAMDSASTEYRKFFSCEEGENRPALSSIFSATDIQTATENYELYSAWYNIADEEIGLLISYIELGFEIRDGN